MKPYNTIISFFIGFVLLGISCQPMETIPIADMIIKGGPIYTMNDNFPMVEAVVVKDGRILDT